MRTVPWVVLGLVVSMLTVDASHALPRFSARTGAKCQSCHVNPSGGTMRQLFGAQYGREELPVPTWSQDFEIENFTTLLASFLGVGADFRTLFFTRQVADTGASTSSTTENAFWQMEGDLYLNFRIAKKVGLFLKKGLYSGFEVFGLLNILPANGHIKIGKFIPNYGTKLDDHTAYIRTYTGLSAGNGSRPELTGFETGVSPGPMNIVVGLFNATDGYGGSGGSSKAILGRVEGLFPVAEKMYMSLGGNVLYKDGGEDASETYYGAIASFGAGDFAAFGEVDLLESKTASGKVTGLVAYAEADYVVTPGVDLKVAWDFYDPDKEQKTGATSRYSFGFEFFPIAGVEVRPMYRIVKDEPTDVSNNEFHLLFHIYL